MRIELLLLTMSLIAVPPANADNSCKHDDHNFRCVTVLRVYDGDTIFVDIPDIHPLIGKNVGVRIRGLDTAEVSTKNTCEKRVGLFTKDQVAALIKKAKRIDLKNVDREKYFRVLADVIVDGTSVANLLLKRGLAYEYHGETKKRIDWCGVERTKVRIPASVKEDK